MWRLEPEEDFFHVYDSKRMLAGYFDPDYGDIPRDRREEAVEAMLKRRDPVPGGYVMVPMVKFRLFDTDLDTDIDTVDDNVLRVHEHLDKWRGFLEESRNEYHSIRISHTDQDMLTIAFPLRFPEPVPLHKDALTPHVSPVFEAMHGSGLL